MKSPGLSGLLSKDKALMLAYDHGLD